MEGLTEEFELTAPQPQESLTRILPRVMARLAVLLLFGAFVVGGLYFGYFFLATVSTIRAVGDHSPGLLPIFSRNDNTDATPRPGATSTPRGGDAPAPISPTDRVTILLIGVDQRDNEKGQPTRSDTMMLLTVDPTGESAGMLSIPRDLWVPIPGGYKDGKINTAHFLGEEFKEPGGGPGLAKRTVEYNFGVRVHYYARVDFRGFERLIDILGGVTINVPKEIIDDAYPNETYGTMRIHILAGRQHMNGKTALQYARTRHADNDFGRMKRQQQVLTAAYSQALGLGLIPKLPSLVGTLREMIDTDVPIPTMLSLANVARSIDDDAIVSGVIDPSMVTDYYGDGTVLLPKREEIRKVVLQVFFDRRVKEEAARIEVQNGTARDKLATTAGATLQDSGFTVAKVSQAPRNDYKETIILDHRKKSVTAGKLAEFLGVPAKAVRSGPASSDDVDITVILGADAQVP